MTKTKVLNLKKLCKFVVDNFLFESMHGKSIFEFITFKIQKFLMISDGQMIKIKVVDPEKL